MRLHLSDDEDEGAKEKTEEEDDRGIKLCLLSEKKMKDFSSIAELVNVMLNHFSSLPCTVKILCQKEEASCSADQ